MDSEDDEPYVETLIFDESIENHFKAIDRISTLCGLPNHNDDFDPAELQRLSSSIMFSREWRKFCYEPTVCRFASAKKSDIDAVRLPQFSSASVPKPERRPGESSSSESRKDVVLYAGGPVWSLDWCPSSHQSSDHRFSCQFLAVAAHPPNSSYHKLGAPITGTGVVQIWSLLNSNVTEEELPPSQIRRGHNYHANPSPTDEDVSVVKKPRGRPKKEKKTEDSTTTLVKRPKGRPKKEKKTKDSATNDLTLVKRPRGSPNKESKRKRSATNDFTYQSENIDELSLPKKQRSERIENLSKGVEEEETLLSLMLRQKPRKKEVIKDLYLDEITNDDLLLPLKSQRGGVRKKKSISKKVSARHNKSNAMKESINNIDKYSQFVTALSVQFPEGTSSGYYGIIGLGAEDSVPKSTQVIPRKKKKKKNKDMQKTDRGHISPHFLLENGDNNYSTAVQEEEKSSAQDAPTLSPDISLNKGYYEKCRYTSPCSLFQTEDNEYSTAVQQEQNKHGQDMTELIEKDTNTNSFENRATGSSITVEEVLPRPVLFLEHNGQVAWDVKWRPCNQSGLEGKHCIGHLAVLLGNGSVEVWEVPSPSVIKILYASAQKGGSDPRFLKLEPVFKCSNLKWGGKQSIPLTLEWSPSPPHDFLLVGCHDGTVGLWKFSTTNSSQDTRPLLSFSADIAPIRALAWHPDGSDVESANVILTAGHSSLKFWDLRDPYRPLWDISPSNKIIYSAEWMPDPRCVILAYDDCTLMIITLPKAASDVPVTGKPFGGPQTQGLHCYSNSLYPTWSIQASRQTGMVAYCSVDGCVYHFQIRGRAVENDPGRNRPDQYLCGYLTDDYNSITMNTPLPNIKLSLKNMLSPTPNTENGTLALCNDKNVSTSKKKLASKLEANPTYSSGEVTQKKKNIDLYPFPSKMIALFKVRWNMNKGSERWLCYGGASGIVRCQEIPRCYF